MTETKTIQPTQGTQPQKERRHGISRRGLLKGAGALAGATIGSAVAGPLAPKPTEAAQVSIEQTSKEKLLTGNYEVVVKDGILLDPKPGYSPWALWNLTTGGQIPPESWTKTTPMQAGISWTIPSDLAGGDRTTIPSSVVVTGSESQILTDPNNKEIEEYAQKEKERLETLIRDTKEFYWPTREKQSKQGFTEYPHLSFYAVRQQNGEINWFAWDFDNEVKKSGLGESFGIGHKDKVILPWELMGQNGVVIQPLGIRTFVPDKGKLEFVFLGPSSRQKSNLIDWSWGPKSKKYIYREDYKAPLSQRLREEEQTVLHIANGKALAVRPFPRHIEFESTEKDLIITPGTFYPLTHPVRVSEDLVMEYLSKPISGKGGGFGKYREEFRNVPLKQVLADNLGVPEIATATTGTQLLDIMRSAKQKHRESLPPDWFEPNQNLAYIPASSPRFGA